MKLNLEKAAFVAALASAAHAVQPRCTIPILANVQLTAAGGRLAIMGTDLDLELTRTLPADIISEGAATVNAAALLKLARKLPGDGNVTLETLRAPSKDESPRLKITSGNTAFELHTLPVEDFPKMDERPWQAVFTLPAETLRTALTQVSMAMSTEETRYYLNGVFLEYAAEGLRMVATDGHRLACKTLAPLPKQCGSCAHVIIPRLTVVELQRLLNGKLEGDITVSSHGERIIFAGPGFQLLSKVVDGTFPDYRRVVPAALPYGVTLLRDKLLEGVELVSTIAADMARAVKLTIYDHAVTLEVQNPDQGNAMHAIKRVAGAMPSKPFEVGFNGRYLAAIGKLIVGQAMDFHFCDYPDANPARPDPGTPAKITDAGDESVFYVLMPMRV